MDVIEEFVILNDEFRGKLTKIFDEISKAEDLDKFADYNLFISAINKLIKDPPSNYFYYKQALDLQDQYNQTLQLVQSNIDIVDDYQNRKTALEDLAVKKRLFKDALSTHKEFTNKRKQLKSIIYDQKATEDLNQEDKLLVQFQAQGTLAFLNTQDLHKLESKLETLSDYLINFINILNKKIDKDNNQVSLKDKMLISILQNFQNNLVILKRYQQKLQYAFCWRLIAASVKADLHFDDPLYAYFALNNKTAELTVAGLSCANNFKFFTKTLKYFKNQDISEDCEDLIARISIFNNNHQNQLMDFNRHEFDFLPSDLEHIIPQEYNFKIGDFLKYSYFRLMDKHDLVSWQSSFIDEKFFTLSSPVVLLLNEAYFQAQMLAGQLAAFSSQNNVHLELHELANMPGFKCAFQIIEIFEMEEYRTNIIKNSVAHQLVNNLAMFNIDDIDGFLTQWQTVLAKSKAELMKVYQPIIAALVDNLEKVIKNLVATKSFSISPIMIRKLEKMITYFADEKTLIKYYAITLPINAFYSYDFFKGENENHSYKINEYNINAFLRFAKLYWSKEVFSAMQLLVDYIKKQNLPVNEQMILKSYNTLLPILGKNNPKQVYLKLMRFIANKYIFNSGDNGEEDSLEFLRLFSENSAKLWQISREENIKDKYLFLRSLLNVQKDQEKDLTSEETMNYGQITFRLLHASRYLQDLFNNGDNSKYIAVLEKNAAKYVNERYSGNNANYLPLIIELAKSPTESRVNILQSYLEKRIINLLTQANTGSKPNLSHFELKSYKFLGENSKFEAIIDSLGKLIDKLNNGKNDHLSNIVILLNKDDIISSYYYKFIKTAFYKAELNRIFYDLPYKSLINNQLFINNIDALILAKLSRRDAKVGAYKNLDSKEINDLVETYCSDIIKQKYRIYRVKLLFESDDRSKTIAYLKQLKPFMNNKNFAKDFIYSPESKEYFINLLGSYIQKINQQAKWSAHYQYLLTTFTPDNKLLLSKIRLVWFKNYLFDFNSLNVHSFELESLEAKLHHDNQKYPNIECSLSDFFAKEDAGILWALIHSRLLKFAPDISDEVLELIDRYLNDNMFIVDDNVRLYSKYLESYKLACKIYKSLKQHDYKNAVDYLNILQSEVEGYQEILDLEINVSNKNKFDSLIIDYDKKILNQLKSSWLELIKEELFSPTALEKFALNDFSDFVMQGWDIASESVKFVQNLESDRDFLANIGQLNDKKDDVLLILIPILSLLSDNNKTQRSFNFVIKDEELSLLRDCLPKTSINYLVKQIDQKINSLDDRNLIKPKFLELRRKINGTGGETRTRTMLPPLDFESSASTSSATPAEIPSENRGVIIPKINHA